jgi:signal transduction histidine kinase
MQTRRNEIKTELDGVDSKLKEAKELLATKEKEQAFLDSLSIYVPTESYKVSHQNTNTAMVNSQKDRKEHNSKHSHSRTGILDLLSKKETVSLEELTEHFYPGKNFNWNNAEVKALSAMIYQLKKEEKLEGASLGSYKLKKQ